MLKQLLSLVLPAWVRPAALAAGAASLFLLGVLVGVTHEGEKHVAYGTAQAASTVTQIVKQVQVVHDVEVKYRDRIHTVYVTGESNVASVPLLVTPDDDRQCTVNAGFVRLYDASWANTVAAPATAAAEFDREPTPISLSDIAEANADNAASCHIWREQAIGLRELYEHLRTVTPTE